MRILIGATCIAVLAAVGYYFWGEWQTSARSAQIEQSREGARAELFRLAGAEPGDSASVRGFCKLMADKRYRDNDNSEFTATLVRNCSALGYR